MAWNEPGGSGNGGKDPWGGGGNRGDDGPPDLDEVVRKIQDKFSKFFGGGGSRRGAGGNGSNKGIFPVILAILAAWLLYDSAYIIQPAERGVVLRFGKFSSILLPGINLQWPRPMDYVIKVNVDEVRTVSHSAQMLTEDENIIKVGLAVQYQVKDAKDFLFQTKDPDLTLKEGTESAIREVIGANKMDYFLSGGRSEIVAKTKTLIQEILDYYKTGLIIRSVNLQDPQPPEEVQDAFADAIKAQEDEQRFKNEAEAYSNDIIPKARGGAARQVADANAYSSKVVARAKGDAQRFTQLLKAYEKAPEVTRERLYLDAMEQVLSSSSKVMTDTKGSNNMLYLPLDRILKRDVLPENFNLNQPSTEQNVPSGSTSKGDGSDGFRDYVRQRSRR